MTVTSGMDSLPIILPQVTTRITSETSSLPALPDRCAAYTPVPGGVGPITVATLMTQHGPQATETTIDDEAFAG
jgi:hypothetical protein